MLKRGHFYMSNLQKKWSASKKRNFWALVWIKFIAWFVFFMFIIELINSSKPLNLNVEQCTAPSLSQTLKNKFENDNTPI